LPTSMPYLWRFSLW